MWWQFVGKNQGKWFGPGIEVEPVLKTDLLHEESRKIYDLKLQTIRCDNGKKYLSLDLDDTLSKFPELAVFDSEGDWKITEYVENLVEGDRDLIFEEQIDIHRTWSAMEVIMAIGKDDPTSSTGGKL